jgi:hypothetical protein
MDTQPAGDLGVADTFIVETVDLDSLLIVKKSDIWLTLGQSDYRPVG